MKTRGFMLIEALFALILMTILIVMFVDFQRKQLMELHQYYLADRALEQLVSLSEFIHIHPNNIAALYSKWQKENKKIFPQVQSGYSGESALKIMWASSGFQYWHCPEKLIEKFSCIEIALKET